jgi:hypothetical protein
MHTELKAYYDSKSGDASALETSCDPITSNLYDAAQEGEVPDTAIKASLGCGNPTALAELKLVKPCLLLQEKLRLLNASCQGASLVKTGHDDGYL